VIAALLALTLAQPAYYTPQEAQALFAQSNDDFYKGDYAKAKDGYLKLIDHGFGGADVLFNLGTACLQAGQLGEAVLYLERARRNARNDDIEANLSYARTLMVDKVIGAGGDEPFLERLAHVTPGDWVSVVFLACWWLFFGAWAAFRFATRRTILGVVMALSLLGSLGFGALTAVQAYVAHNVIEAVVMPQTAKVFEFPGDNAKVAFEVHSGLKIRLMEESGKFARIRLPNGLEGWTDKTGVTAL
jgi:tetratricopeptide (TPR) repeat protein